MKAIDEAIDLSTRYLGLTLKSPLVAGASPLTGEVDNIRRLEDLGAGAVVLPSILMSRARHLIRSRLRRSKSSSTNCASVTRSSSSRTLCSGRRVSQWVAYFHPGVLVEEGETSQIFVAPRNHTVSISKRTFNIGE
jgi:hypothetical protein